ncbi:hypothetical protein INT45_011289 [Circinella minor]|uniref:Uncharacterized protein n=1 Tax=Circinella minor TaxID=1195481 RepID=A0A8H7RYA9_9FUNG|nr:hypothetical protein INT45_011289 [Circinella minor]
MSQTTSNSKIERVRNNTFRPQLPLKHGDRKLGERNIFVFYASVKADDAHPEYEVAKRGIGLPEGFKWKSTLDPELKRIFNARAGTEAGKFISERTAIENLRRELSPTNGDYTLLKMRVDGLPSRLARRRKHAEGVKKKSRKELQRKRIVLTNEEFESGWDSFVQSVQLAYVDERSDQQKLDEQYVHHLEIFYTAHQNILKDVLHRSGKLGHNTSTQIIRSANNATAKAKKILNDYNNACKGLDPNFPDMVFNEIKSLESTFWEYDTSSRLDFGALREYSRQLRADEEIRLLEDEARELNSYATRRCRRLLKAKETEERGVAYECLIERKLADAKKQFYKINGFMFDENSEENVIAGEEDLNDDED